MAKFLKKNSADIVLQAYKYAEISKLRENIVKTLQEKNQKTVLITGPHDEAGNTFLVSLLGFNTASFSSMKVLMVDLNMRRPQLHIPFGLKIKTGFSEIAAGSLNWKRAVKNTGISGLKVITAGQPNMELAPFLKHSLLENLVHDMKGYFDLILFDTSPVLSQNRNNVDPALLALLCDMVIIVIQDKKTTKADLTNAVSTIGEKVDGIVYNRNF